MERVKSRNVLPHEDAHRVEAHRPEAPHGPRHQVYQDGFEAAQPPKPTLRKTPPRSAGAKQIDDVRSPLDEIRDRPHEIAGNLASKLDKARSELSPESTLGNTRLVALSQANSAKSVVGYLRGWMNGTVTTMNNLKTGSHLSTSLEHAIEYGTIRPMVERVKSGLIDPTEAAKLLDQAADVLSQHPTIKKAVKDIEKGNKASANVSKVLGWNKGKNRREKENRPDPSYSVPDFVREKFQQLLKVMR